MKGTGKHRGIGGIASRRREAVRVITAKKRSASSTKWLKRQLNDPYVAAAKEAGYRSRSAFKLLQLNERFHLLRPGMKVVDLGAAPGGWSQAVVQKIGKKGKLVALDILPIAPIEGAQILQMDFLAPEADEKLRQALGGKADIVLSDMSPATTGHSKTDHLRIMALAEAAAYFAIENLSLGGTFVCKVFQGGAYKELLSLLKSKFSKIKHAKPPASRPESPETYLIAQGFRGKD